MRIELVARTIPRQEGTRLASSMVYSRVNQPAGHTRSPAPAARGEVILFLEDEAVVRQVGEMMLDRLGYTVVSAKDGQEALARARTLERIDLFLTDVILPGGMNGRAVAEQLARERPGLRVLFASGSSHDAFDNPDPSAPALRLIHKPYDLHQLDAAIRAALAAPAP